MPATGVDQNGECAVNIVDKSWGREEIIHNGDYCCKLLVYTERKFSSKHYHRKKHETFYVVSGKFVIQIGEIAPCVRILAPGDTVVLEPGIVHRLRCLSPGTIVESSTHDDPDDCVRLIPSEE